jgi:GntR family transcriptional regulator, transcriptional repressor for pyruvate dehydrogenase complex
MSGSPALAVARVRPAYTQVAEQLRHLIIGGDVAPGDRLPVETDLATMFGVSRSTVREALRSLASENLVVTKRGVNGGTFVAEPSTDSLSSYMETSLGLLAGTADISVGELLEVRSFIEIPAVEQAAVRRTPEQLAFLKSCLHSHHGPLADHNFEGNRDFHVAIVEASGNRLLCVVANPIFTVLRTRFLRDRAPRDFWECVNTDHQEIYTAIERQDPQAAGDLMREHLSRLRETYEQIDIDRETERAS